MTTRPRRAPRAGAAALAALLGAASGCAAVGEGPVVRPEIYPDRSSPEAAWASFLWAWKNGDVSGLRATLGGWLLADLDKQLARNGPEAVADYYRRGAQDLEVTELDWTHRGEALAYLRVRLRGGAGQGDLELLFSLLRRPDGKWVVTNRMPVR